MLFGFIFLANDPQTLPYTNGGRILYGIFLGVIAVIFRNTAQIEGVFVFALLVVNALSLYLDKLAFDIKKKVKQAASYLKNNLGSYEKLSAQAKQGEMPKLEDTQELLLEPVTYNMPPIDNKITKVKRRKKSVLEKIKEKQSDNAKKKQKEKERQTEKANTEKEDSDGSLKTDKTEKDTE